MKKVVTLIADYGKVLTDGYEYGTALNVPEGQSLDNIKEITIDEYNEIKNEERATIEDYKNALKRLGVL